MSFFCHQISLISEITDMAGIEADDLRWIAMWLIAGAVFFAAKTLMLAMSPALQGWRRFAYLFLWPGFDARPWRGAGARSEGVPLRWFSGLPAVALGLALIEASGLVPCNEWGRTWIGMVGVILCLHFGAFRWLAWFWQRMGISVRPIMEAPLAAVTLSEFWGVRWNRGFRDFAQVCIGLPVAKRWGRLAALWVVLVFSGLVHELVISVPSGAGYGWPFGYFVLQAVGIMAEKRFCLRGHLWVLTMTGPLALLLFHPPFVERVMHPFLETLRQMLP